MAKGNMVCEQQQHIKSGAGSEGGANLHIHTGKGVEFYSSHFRINYFHKKVLICHFDYQRWVLKDTISDCNLVVSG